MSRKGCDGQPCLRDPRQSHEARKRTKQRQRRAGVMPKRQDTAVAAVSGTAGRIGLCFMLSDSPNRHDGRLKRSDTGSGAE